MNWLGLQLVELVRFLKKTFGVKTFYIESAFVLVVLVAIGVLSHKGWIEWIGVLAVFFTFQHALIADRLQEAQVLRQYQGEAPEVGCHYKLPRLFIMKEMLWFVYFILLGAWSALGGVVLFLLYTPWRKLWRHHNPVDKKKLAEDKPTPIQFLYD